MNLILSSNRAVLSYEFRYLLIGAWDNDFSVDKYVASPYLGINNSVLMKP
ncbi:MAG: hypothetical protein U0T36_12270 [Saprospiraceae bacterium]